MSLYTFDSRRIPWGTIQAVISNQDGSSDPHDINGKFIRSIGEVAESSERTGYGGELLVSDIEIEAYDRGRQLSDTILNVDTVPSADLLVKVTKSGTEVAMFAGSVDFETIKENTLFDDGTSEEHTLKLTAYSLEKKLELVSMADLRSALDAVKVSYTGLSTAAAYAFQAGGTFGNDPSTGTVAWANPYGARYSDDNRATATLTLFGGTSEWLKVTNFGFAIPADETPKGIIFGFERSGTVTDGIQDNSIKSVKGSVIGGTDMADTSHWATSDETVLRGGENELWGQTWTYADINSSGFGVAISAKLVNAGVPAIARLDRIYCTIHTQKGGVDRYYVKFTDIFQEAAKLTGYEINSFSHTIQQSFRHVAEFDPVDVTKTFDDLWIAYQDSNTAYTGFWTEDENGLFMNANNVKEFLMFLAAQFLAYPRIEYDATTNKIDLELIQRGYGTSVDEANLGALLEASRGHWLGYDDVAVHNLKSDTYTFQSLMTKEQFDLLTQKTSQDYYWELLGAFADYTQEIYTLMIPNTATEMTNVTRVVDTNESKVWLGYGSFLLYFMNKYWVGFGLTTWTPPVMLERKYEGLCLSPDTEVRRFDRLIVASKFYTVTELIRNVEENTTLIKSVLY